MAVLTDKQMDKHIKERNFAKVYLIYGEEQMYVKKYTDKLVTAVAGKTPSEFNFHSFGDSINFDELAASVQIVPFMSEFNCVLVSDAAFDEFNANDNARFADIYKAVPDGCVFIVSLPSVKPVKNKTVLPALKKYADKNGYDMVFLDTAGRLHNKANLMQELSKLRKIIDRETPDAAKETLLVLDATTGQNGLQQAKVFRETAGLTGIILTKLDGTAKGGICVAIAQELGVPVKFVGLGEGIDDLQPFDAKEYVNALI